tara:strand:+ start:20199 stop:20771 length:573 start_codon:yes stop_codon:yes gene_type:complete
MKILAIDQSLTATGVAAFVDGNFVPTLLAPKKLKGAERLDWFRTRITTMLLSIDPDVVVMEGYAYAAKFSHAHSLGELGGIIKLAILDQHKRVPLKLLVVPPTTLKKFVSGKGNCKKAEILLHVYKRWGETFSDDNLADAYALAMVGSAKFDLDFEAGITQEMVKIAASIPLEDLPQKVHAHRQRVRTQK